MSPDWEAVGYVVSSEYRRDVVEVLADGPATPSTLADEIDTSMPHVSEALSGLRDRGLVELLVPESRRKGRLYGLTDDGEAVRSVIEREDL